MHKEDNSISYRIYFVAFAILLFAILVVFKLTQIQHGFFLAPDDITTAWF
jgi:hypothetical protein